MLFAWELLTIRKIDNFHGLIPDKISCCSRKTVYERWEFNFVCPVTQIWKTHKCTNVWQVLGVRLQTWMMRHLHVSDSKWISHQCVFEKWTDLLNRAGCHPAQWFCPPDNTHISSGQSMPCYTSNELYNDLQMTSTESCRPLRLWCECVLTLC